MHDVDEAYTGDVPAPFKWENPDAKHALAVGGMDYVDKHDIPYPRLSDSDARLLKIADMVDLVLSSLEEMGRGNSYAKQLVANGEAYLSSMFSPEDKTTDHGLWDKVNEMVWEVKNQWQQTINR
jgi:5'-deoxynucleotidase YfbR-like HD superfamily hydrolase